MLEELSGDDRADGVTADVLRAARAAAVAIEARDRVEPARLQRPPSTLRCSVTRRACHGAMHNDGSVRVALRD